LASAHSKELSSFKWDGNGGRGTAGYLTGYLCAKRAISAGIGKAILDAGLTIPGAGSNTFAVLKGAVDAGLEVPCDEGIFPKMERIKIDDDSFDVALGKIDEGYPEES